jgi:hypothetical protein
VRVLTPDHRDSIDLQSNEHNLFFAPKSIFRTGFKKLASWLQVASLASEATFFGLFFLEKTLKSRNFFFALTFVPGELHVF